MSKTFGDQSEEGGANPTTPLHSAKEVKAYKATIFFYTDNKEMKNIKDYVARMKEIGNPLKRDQIKTLLLHRRKQLIVRREIVIEEDKNIQKLLDNNYTGDMTNEDFSTMINDILKDITGEAI